MSDTPDRKCNGPRGGPWCGARAEFVCCDATGMERFACEEHVEVGDTATPLAVWFAQVHGHNERMRRGGPT